ncbi:hypothetical protein PBY51_023540 [Eleginops maclovinus]|uniref:Secreted protein n=1 Tax=Eleginops maclovinus TaxID=56733 RepID=A0AAN7WYJ3_ELEMC|nr:hypothetical protein PBY51_023540 [Eleginops maclovinus]
MCNGTFYARACFKWCRSRWWSARGLSLSLSIILAPSRAAAPGGPRQRRTVASLTRRNYEAAKRDEIIANKTT